MSNSLPAQTPKRANANRATPGAGTALLLVFYLRRPAAAGRATAGPAPPSRPIRPAAGPCSPAQGRSKVADYAGAAATPSAQAGGGRVLVARARPGTGAPHAHPHRPRTTRTSATASTLPGVRRAAWPGPRDRDGHGHSGAPTPAPQTAPGQVPPRPLAREASSSLVAGATGAAASARRERLRVRPRPSSARGWPSRVDACGGGPYHGPWSSSWLIQVGDHASGGVGAPSEALFLLFFFFLEVRVPLFGAGWVSMAPARSYATR
ncbi:hypothetical protein HNR07_003355 [Nocardiopsis metallicus]|uniref:Uncharacterized protein n=1 Tax=Nocardiopsis metallicus TaxID=179819 RepID=A0A840WQ33_9ACTN|nr:hypothetical protein [Nocardiopsis metallicus]